MTTIEVAGPAASALTHMALVGVAAVIQEHAGVVPTIRWIESDRVMAQITVPDLSPTDVAGAIGEHAGQRAKPDQWVNSEIDHEGRVTATFSPRIKPPSDRTSWERLQDARHWGVDLVPTMANLDLRLIQALGEPAYWRFVQKGQRPDEGASRWEMKTRNKGEEFIGNRFRLLADAVSQRDTRGIIDGLTGATIVDECGKGKQDSRSATGLTRPRPTDNVLAWCALWGIAQFPVVHQIGRRSITAGYMPGSREHRYPAAMVVPMPIRPMTPARFRTLVRSPELIRAGQQGLTRTAGDIDDPSIAVEWFRVRGVGGLMRFPFERVGSTSAPENRLLDGVMIPTGARPMREDAPTR